MPEIAECAKYTSQLQHEYGSHNLLKVTAIGGRFLKKDIGLIYLNYPLNNVQFHSKGKFLYWSFDGDIYFFITLGMSGSFGKQNKHSAIQFDFDNGTVYFNDIRHFGTFKIADNKLALTRKLNSLGWDPLKEPKIPNYLVNSIRKQNHKAIGTVLMDQKVFAGLGNYLRSEILYASGVNPFAFTFSVSDQSLLTIAENYRRIAEEAYQHGGATFATYSDLYGISGDFYKQFKVYGRKKDPLGNDIISQEGPDGRTVHWVKEVQAL